jgi:hypothetical protein
MSVVVADGKSIVSQANAVTSAAVVRSIRVEALMASAVVAEALGVVVSLLIEGVISDAS